MIVGYLITMSKTNSETQYITVDEYSGGYLCWTTFIGSAKVYSTEEEARKELNDSDFTKDVKLSSGEMHPARLIHSGLGLSNSRMENSGIISIQPLELGDAIYSKSVTASLRRPKKKYLRTMDKSVCRDCLEVLAFGNEAIDVLIHHYGEGLAHERLEEIEKGIQSMCRVLDGIGKQIIFTFVSDNEDKKIDFSSATCECCGTKKAGERYFANFLEITTSVKP